MTRILVLYYSSYGRDQGAAPGLSADRGGPARAGLGLRGMTVEARSQLRAPSLPGPRAAGY
jgi:hypothetical protein